MQNHKPKAQAAKIDRMCQQMNFLMGIDPRTRDVVSVTYLMRAIEDDLTVLRHLVVDDMRAAGASWAEVGVALGISRQAAWSIYAPARELVERMEPPEE